MLLVLTDESFTLVWRADAYLSVSLIFPQDYEDAESEAFDVSLTKNAQGLGITIAGYVGDKNSGGGENERTDERSVT